MYFMSSSGFAFPGPRPRLGQGHGRSDAACPRPAKAPVLGLKVYGIQELGGQRLGAGGIASNSAAIFLRRKVPKSRPTKGSAAWINSAALSPGI